MEFLTVVCFSGQSIISMLFLEGSNLSHINMAVYENIHTTEWNYRDMQKEGCRDCLVQPSWFQTCVRKARPRWFLSFDSWLKCWVYFRLLTSFSKGCWLSLLESGKSLKHILYFILFLVGCLWKWPGILSSAGNLISSWFHGQGWLRFHILNRYSSRSEDNKQILENVIASKPLKSTKLRLRFVQGSELCSKTSGSRRKPWLV